MQSCIMVLNPSFHGIQVEIAQEMAQLEEEMKTIVARHPDYVSSSSSSLPSGLRSRASSHLQSHSKSTGDLATVVSLSSPRCEPLGRPWFCTSP